MYLRTFFIFKIYFFFVKSFFQLNPFSFTLALFNLGIEYKFLAFCKRTSRFTLFLISLLRLHENKNAFLNLLSKAKTISNNPK